MINLRREFNKWPILIPTYSLATLNIFFYIISLKYFIYFSTLDGNPVTGEGYKAGATDYVQPASINNGNQQVINKNRIPPGGYSSGLW